MALISCTTGTLALYAQEDGSILAKPVEAWDDAGAPYVAAATVLVAAQDAGPGTFQRLEMAAVVLPPPREVRVPDRVGRPPRPGPRPVPEGPRERPGV
ncbi:hypothetical protein [Nonomuraea sp. 10N515B]|uniref:hypothetical protein n=1 Tax=Nonomuraea sp. 10N515B TaxID=3457422 RepID=UPI003FCCD55A